MKLNLSERKNVQILLALLLLVGMIAAMPSAIANDSSSDNTAGDNPSPSSDSTNKSSVVTCYVDPSDVSPASTGSSNNSRGGSGTGSATIVENKTPNTSNTSEEIPQNTLQSQVSQQNQINSDELGPSDSSRWAVGSIMIAIVSGVLSVFVIIGAVILYRQKD